MDPSLAFRGADPMPGSRFGLRKGHQKKKKMKMFHVVTCLLVLFWTLESGKYLTYLYLIEI